VNRTLFGIITAGLLMAGIGVKAAGDANDPMLMGADTAPVEVHPNPDPQLALPVHEMALAINGVHLLESLDLEDLAAKNLNAFALIMEPLKLEGGSTLARVAVYEQGKP
jgi:hypothetical protein